MNTETRQTLCANGWVSLEVVRKPDAGVDGYVYSHETRCMGRIVAVLPYRDTEAGREYLVKSEMTPCWGFDQVLSAITGGYEGGDIEDDAVREMLEETGYEISRSELIPLGESFGTKSTDTIYTLFSADLTGREAGEAIGDGTRVEAESAAVWLAAECLISIMDPQVAVMYVRLSDRLGTGTREAAIRADERARIRSLLPYNVNCCEGFPAAVADLINEHEDSPVLPTDGTAGSLRPVDGEVA